MNKLQSSSLLKGDGAADSELAVKRFDSAQWQHWVSSENQKWQRWILLVLALDTSGNIFLGLGSREGGEGPPAEVTFLVIQTVEYNRFY